MANGQLKTETGDPLPERLAKLARQLEALIDEHQPDAAAVEEVFVNKNPQSTLKLGQARGVVLMIAARAGIPVGEYAARFVKKAVVGIGNAEKPQVHDGDALGAVGLGPALGDIDDARVEIGTLPREARVDEVGALVRGAAPVGLGDGEALVGEQPAGGDVVEIAADGNAAIGTSLDGTGDQGAGASAAPFAE